MFKSSSILICQHKGQSIQTLNYGLMPIVIKKEEDANIGKRVTEEVVEEKFIFFKTNFIRHQIMSAITCEPNQ